MATAFWTSLGTLISLFVLVVIARSTSFAAYALGLMWPIVVIRTALLTIVLSTMDPKAGQQKAVQDVEMAAVLTGGVMDGFECFSKNSSTNSSSSSSGTSSSGGSGDDNRKMDMYDKHTECSFNGSHLVCQHRQLFSNTTAEDTVIFESAQECERFENEESAESEMGAGS